MKDRRAFAAPLLVIAVGLVVSRLLAPDYFDAGALGLPVTMLVAGAAQALLLAKLAPSLPAKAPAVLWSVSSWSFGLAGMSYAGFFFLPLEVFLSYRSLRARAGLAGRRALGTALGTRLLALAAMAAL